MSHSFGKECHRIRNTHTHAHTHIYTAVANDAIEVAREHCAHEESKGWQLLQSYREYTLGAYNAQCTLLLSSLRSFRRVSISVFSKPLLSHTV
jgi:hypothetical protein